jgi:hypothetical protein
VIKNYEGIQTRRRLTDEELGDDALAAYDEARELIDGTDLSEIPLSSIDYIRWRLTQEGYRVDEITGRENIIDYTTNGVNRVRSSLQQRDDGTGKGRYC